MTCINIGNAIICMSPWGRMKLGNKYVWLEYHEYCGPTFYWDSNMTKLYDPVDENDPIWDLFDVWLKKYRANKEKEAAARVKEKKKKIEDALKKEKLDKLKAIQDQIKQLKIEQLKLKDIK
jgi:hypothetical protein